MVLCEVGMQSDVLQATQRDVIHGRHADDGIRVEHPIFDYAQAAGALRDQHGVPVREEHQAIGMRQPFRQLDDPNRHAAHALQYDRLVNRGARESVGRILACDLIGCEWLGDAGRAHRHRTLLLLGKCRKGNRHKDRGRHRQMRFASHNSPVLYLALCLSWPRDGPPAIVSFINRINCDWEV
jgi:hypothetical protein